ncbi:ZIP family metal transporter [Candidatus Nitrosotalea okcheonensis]|uniref:Zinc/iron permease n=1 Tax=Candidatus Nitrosotalea okcheonensis TaxID=1903276 RepID=A0A2H1FGG1_9ARCH|nr:hypothetical protein [Candidatus Nitrosotalea okcheonensis]SMH71837.1 membrane protein of unknown function [Candidatus Nitrosotalea okcheonensis]
MIDYTQLLLLGAIAGFTIFLGLPLVVMKNLSTRAKGFLNAFALGILVFLIIDVFSHTWESATSAATDASAGKASLGDAVIDLVALFGGIAIGLLGLVLYEHRAMTKRVPQVLSLESIKQGDDHLRQSFHEISAYRLAMMIAVGIGAHNTTEGFGIAGPLTGVLKRPTARFLILAGLVGG